MTDVAAWFLYSIMIASLLGLAAVACESALRGSGRQGRWAWVAAMLLSVAIPFLAWAGVSVRSVPAVPDSALITLTPLVIGVSDSGSQAGLSLDGALMAIWVVAGSALLIYLALSWAAIVRDRRNWRRDVVDGVPVLVTQGTGPAVWGIRHPRILLPEWALTLESRVRRLMLLHEGEHVRAGDTRLVLLGLLLLAAAPWNLPLWWQFRRLRQAVELDCDSRVLRRIPDARRYGALLLEVGRRRSAPVMAVALAEPAGFLERRIRMITMKAKNVSFRRIVGFAGLAVLLTALAVCTRDPMAVADDVEPPVELVATEYIDVQPEFTPFTVAPRLQNADEVQRLLERMYPPLLRDAGIGGLTSVWFYLDTDGSILKTQVSGGSGYPALDQAAIAVAEAMRFSPALNRDVPVRVWVSLPIRFTTGDGGTATRNSTLRDSREREAAISERLIKALEAGRAQGAIDKEPEPDGAIPPPPLQEQRPDPAKGPAFTPFTKPPRLMNSADVQAVLQQEYPPILRDAGISGKSVVWLFIDETGQVKRSQIAEPTGYPALDAAALRVAATMRFTAAENKGKAVAVWVSIPISFSTR